MNHTIQDASFPGNRSRARTQATRMPTGRLAATAQAEIHRLSRKASHLDIGQV